MRMLVTILLAGTALSTAPAYSQTLPGEAAAEVVEGREIIVLGRGETRQVQELDNRDLTILAAGTSPLKAIEKLPGVNFQSADPFGTYEWSQRVSIRGFSQTQLGFTLDGIPLGDGTYGNNNGLHISRAITSDNIGVTRVSQGAGSIGTQATNNLGGTLEFFSLDPKGEYGVDANLTYGSENTKRGFVRVNVGTADGPRGFISYAYMDADKWKGVGVQRSQHVNAKALVPVGAATFDAYFSYSDRVEQDYQDLSLEQIGRLGYGWDNVTNDYALALRLADIGANRGETGAPLLNPAAGTVYPAPITNVDDAYYDASGLRTDTLGAFGLTAPLDDAVTFKIKAYYHDNAGQGTWFTPYVPSPTGVPISVRTTEYDIQRGGIFSSIAANLGNYALTVGGWYEHNDFRQARRFYALASRTDPGRSARSFQRNPFATQWDFNFNTDTLQYYVQNKLTLGDATLNVGWKGFSVTNEAVPVIQGALPSGTIKSRDWFQPHIGAAYKLADKAELFAGFTQVTRAFVSSATSGPFSTTQAGFNAIRSTLKPEESDTFEVGARYNDRRFNGTIGAYLVNFRNRLLGFATGAGIVGNPSVLQNVGGVRSIGVEAAGDLRLGGGLTLFASYAYNDSTYRNDVFNALNVRLAATKGKTVVDSPKHLLRGEIGYDDQALFARLAGNFVSRRYFTYENDQSVPDRVLVDATIGYRLDLGLRKPVEIQVNATNLFDKKYVATIGSNGFGNRGDNQTLLAGSPQQFFVTLKGGF
jgi:iron complex outermembrane recepter protein